MADPYWYELKVTELQEEMACRLFPYYQYDEVDMRMKVKNIVVEVWSGNRKSRALPELRGDTALLESQRVLKRYNKHIRQLIHNQITHAEVDKVRWTLLLLRLARLKEWPPVSQHLQAFNHMTELMKERFGWQFPLDRGPIIPIHGLLSLEPQPSLSQTTPTQPSIPSRNGDKDDDVLDLMASDISDRESSQRTTCSQASKRTAARKRNRQRMKSKMLARPTIAERYRATPDRQAAPKSVSAEHCSARPPV